MRYNKTLHFNSKLWGVISCKKADYLEFCIIYWIRDMLLLPN